MAAVLRSIGTHLKENLTDTQAILIMGIGITPLQRCCAVVEPILRAWAKTLATIVWSLILYWRVVAMKKVSHGKETKNRSCHTRRPTFLRQDLFCQKGAS